MDLSFLRRRGSIREASGSLRHKKNGGKEVGKATSEVAKDGKTTTVVTDAKADDGKQVKATSVYEKQ